VISTYVAAVFFCAASVLVGHAFLGLAGARSWGWLEPGVGFGLLIGVGGGGAWAFGGGLVVTMALLALVVAAVVGWVRSRPTVVGWRAAVATCALVLAALALPFLVAGDWGLLGGAPSLPENVLGPAALAEALARIPGVSPAQAFQGELLAIVALSGLTALGAIGHLGAKRRVVGACMVALAYLSVCSFLAAAAWTMAEALFVLTTAVALLQVERGRADGTAVAGNVSRWGIGLALAIGVGVFFSNSVAGLVWPAVIATRWSVNRRESWGRLRPRALARALRTPTALLLLAAVAGLALLAAFVVPFSVDRLATADAAAVAPAAGLGIWPHESFVLEGGYGVEDWLATLLAGAVILLSVLWWLSRREAAIPISFGVSSIIYLLQPLFAQDYTRAQALAVVAPLAMLVAVRPLLEELGGDATPSRPRPPGLRRPDPPLPPRAVWAILAVAFIGAAAYSSGLALTADPPEPAAADASR
jgi:hypothetical protein